MITDGRGQHNVERRKKNEQMILDYLQEQESTTISECARALGLTRVTVANALKRLGVKKG